MLKKIIKIQNVGKFRDFHARGDLEFHSMTLIYAENGRGKTTLCDILHSLRSGNPEYINGRHSLGCDEKPEVHIRLDGDTAVFQEGAWSKAYPDIAIFDTAFIHQNVYAGDYVNHEHKKNLYRVIVGEEGVKLTKEVDDLNGRVRSLNKEINTKRTVVEKYVPKDMTLKQFLPLSKDSNIDQKIKDAEAEVLALERASEITSKNALEMIALPALPDNFQSLLAKQLKDVSQDAEILLHDHLSNHTEKATETWLNEGIDYVKDDACPFCAQSVSGNKLVEAYQTYFSASYRTLKEEVSSL